MHRARLYLAAMTAAGLAATGLGSATAGAGISGPCSVTFAGSNVASRDTGATARPIAVGHDASAPIVMSASGRLARVRIELEFAGISWVVKDKVVATNVYRDTLRVKDYATYGVGLYKASGVGTGPGLSCSGSALVRVKGSPFASVAGIAGIAAAILGAAGVLFGGLGAHGTVKPFRVVRSSAAGLIAALGLLVILQEAAILYPTRTVAIAGLALGLAVGAAAAAAPLFGHHAIPTGRGMPGRPATPAV